MRPEQNVFLVYLRKAQGWNEALNSDETQLFLSSLSPLSKRVSEMCLFEKHVTLLHPSISSLTQLGHLNALEWKCMSF